MEINMSSLKKRAGGPAEARERKGEEQSVSE